MLNQIFKTQESKICFASEVQTGLSTTGVRVILLLLLLLRRFSRVRLCDPTDGSPPGSSVPGILQARTLEWVAIAFSNA